MRKITFIYTLLGFSIYLFGVVIGISLPQLETYSDLIIPTALPLTPQEIIQKFEPNHGLIANKLSQSEIYVILTEEEKIYLAREYFLLGRPVEGENILQSLLDESSPSLHTVIQLADHYHSLGLFERELESLTKISDFSNEPEISRRLILLTVLFGNSIIRESNFPLMQADDPLAQILNIHELPNDSQKSLLFGAQLARMTEWKLAEKLLENEYKLAPENSDLYPLVALERISLGNTNETQKILSEIEKVGLSHYQTSDQALVALVYVYSGDSERAIEIFQKLAKLQPEEPLWERNIAQLIALNTPLTALENLLNLSKSKPSVENYTALLIFTIDHPAYIQPYGIDAYQKLANTENQNVELLLNMARFDLARNEPIFALAMLDKVISSGVSTGYYNDALWLRATTNLTLQNESAAKGDLLEILHFYPPSRYSKMALQLYEANFLDSFR